MRNFTSLNNKICAFNQFFNEGKDGANLIGKAVVITMLFVITGVGSATAATSAIANLDTSSTTIDRRPRPAPPAPTAPPNGEGSDEPWQHWWRY